MKRGVRLRGPVFVLYVLLGTAGPARAADERRLLDQAEAAFQAAVEAQAQGDEPLAEDLLDEAEERLRSVLEASPRQAFALGRLGALHNLRGRHAEVRALLEPAVAAGVSAAEVRFQLALALERTGEPARAVALADALVAEAPRSPLALGLQGRLRARRGELAGAAEALARRRAVDTGKGRDAQDLLQLEADVALRRHRPADAVPPLEDLLRARGGPADVRNLAAALAASGAADRARGLLAGLDERERRKPRTLAVQAYAELAAGRPLHALEAARLLAQAGGGLRARARVLEGRALADLGRTGEARSAFQAALSEAPDHADAHAGLGVLLWQQGAAQAARPHLERATRALPHRAAVCAAYGQTLSALGQREIALGALRGCAADHEDDPRPVLALARLLSEGAAGKDSLDEAIGVLEAARRSRSPAVVTALVYSLRRRARLDLERAQASAERRALCDAALTALDRAAALDPADGGVAMDQAVALLLAGRPAEAMRRLAPGVERGDAALVALYLRAATSAGQAAAALPAARRARARLPRDLRLVAELAAAEVAAGQSGAAADTLHGSGRADLDAAEARARVQEVALLLARDEVDAAYGKAQLAARLDVPGPARDGVDVALVLAGLRAGRRDGLAPRAARLAEPAAQARLGPWVGGGAAHLRAVTTYLSGRMNEAARAAEQALTSAPRSVELARIRGYALLALGAQRLDAGVPAAASDALRAATRLLPADDPSAATLRAALAWRRGDRATAERLWSLAGRDVPEALVGLGLVAGERGQRARAQELYRRYLRGGDDERVRRWLELSQRFSEPGGRP